MNRKQHAPAEKAKIVLEALRGEKTINEIASEHGIHPNMLSRWKREAEENLYTLFKNDSAQKRREQREHEAEMSELYAKIGELTTHVEWLKKNLVSNSTPRERREMVEPNGSLSIKTQAVLLGVSRSSIYRKPTPPSEAELELREMIDRIYTAHPEFGTRRMCVWLNRNEGVAVGRKAVRRCMREMGLQAVYPRQRTSVPHPGHKIWPYLLDGLAIERPDQVWSVDITYIPIRGSWLYLMAVMDWYSRYVLSWRISDGLEMGFVLEAAKEALGRSRPEILNSDQGSHFTSSRFTSLFLEVGAQISMDHRGRAYDNIYVERLWRTVKYEEVYLREYATPREARDGIGRYLNWYNEERPHQSIGYRTPKEVWAS